MVRPVACARLAAAPALAVCALLAAPAAPAGAQQDFSAVTIEVVPVAPGVSMLVGRGGNIGVSAGADGVFLVDDQYAPLTDKIRAAVATIDVRPIRFVLNTHWHGDHTGGNENLGQTGTLIVAHDNVRVRMSSEQLITLWEQTVPPSPAGALPVVTFSDAVTFHLNGDEIHAFHVPPAHTDGDSIVHFRKADVIHAGDVFFSGGYPFIDLGTGGDVDGVAAAAERMLELAGEGTKIIPGHGPLATRADLVRYRDMLAGCRAAVAALIAAGKSREETIAAKPTAPFDEAWGQSWIKPDVFAGILYDSLSK
jgi:glyoxylase-like metal-dependent hydrolase (beta-lactamase superfamily II)